MKCAFLRALQRGDGGGKADAVDDAERLQDSRIRQQLLMHSRQTGQSPGACRPKLVVTVVTGIDSCEGGCVHRADQQLWGSAHVALQWAAGTK